jgi:hypothetical protein
MYPLAFNGGISHDVSWNERTRARMGAVRDQYEVSTDSEPSTFP